MKNFSIDKNKGIVSNKFFELNILDFEKACQFISELPYKRNQNKNNVLCVFEDNGGTCSTKQAVLRKLALENNHENVRLMLGIFKMDAKYAPSINDTLQKYQLEYIPEAHNYLKIEDKYVDFTKPNSDYKDFKDKILIEKEIEYNQINTEKIEIHKSFLENWIINENSKYTLNEIWQIREKCIEGLQNIN